MERSPSSSKRGGVGLPPIPPQSSESTTSDALHQEIEASGPHRGDVLHATVAKRRAANREYSERYRRKKHDHVLKLEDQQKSLEVEISDNSPKLEYYKEVESYLVAENISLKEKFSQVSSDLEAEEAEAEMLTFELEQLKLIDEVQQAQIPEMMKFKGK